MAKGAVAPSSLPVAVGRTTSYDNVYVTNFTVSNINQLCPSHEAIAHNKKLTAMAVDQNAVLHGAGSEEGPIRSTEPTAKRVRLG